MQTVILSILIVALSFVSGYIVAALLVQRSVKTEVLQWLMQLERTTREEATVMRSPLATIELPGYQAIVRRFRLKFDV